MARQGRKNADPVLALLLAQGKTVTDAARESGVCERTVRRRLADPEFVRQVDAARAQLMEAALGELVDGLTQATKTLVNLLKSESDQVKLGAVRTYLEASLRFREQVELSRRLGELEQALAAQKEAET
jgi:hypothetical protein